MWKIVNAMQTCKYSQPLIDQSRTSWILNQFFFSLKSNDGALKMENGNEQRWNWKRFEVVLVKSFVPFTRLISLNYAHQIWLSVPHETRGPRNRNLNGREHSAVIEVSTPFYWWRRGKKHIRRLLRTQKFPTHIYLQLHVRQYTF